MAAVIHDMVVNCDIQGLKAGHITLSYEFLRASQSQP